MKKIFTLIFSITFSLSLFAASLPARLSISSLIKYPLRVMIDGRTYYTSNVNEFFMINNITPGYHGIKIYKEDHSYQNRGRFNDNFPLIYNNHIYLKPGFHVDIMINRFGKSFIDETEINSDYPEDQNDDAGNNNFYKTPMNAYIFSKLKQTINNEAFENTKLVFTKDAIGRNYFTAAQVKEIVQLFDFENNKLEIAKFAYKYTIDRNNYFLVNDVFEFSNSKVALAKYLRDLVIGN